MDKNSVDYYVSALAIQAEIEAMKAENDRRKMIEQSQAYTEADFYVKAEELRDLINFWNI